MNANRIFTLFRSKVPSFLLCKHPCLKKYLYSYSLQLRPFSVGYKYSAAVSHLTIQENIFKRMWKKLSALNLVKKSELNRDGFRIYEAVADKINYELFVKEFEMHDSFFSWFLITELHLWMMSVRLMNEGEDGKLMRNAAIEALWLDTQSRVKLLGELNSSDVREDINEFLEQFQASLFGYDEGILSSDMVLAGALWRRFLQSKCNDPEKVEILVHYIRKQVLLLDDIPLERLKKCEMTWIPLETYLDKWKKTRL